MCNIFHNTGVFYPGEGKL